MVESLKEDSASELSVKWNEGLHLPELDGIRGFAILIVTLYRYGKEMDPTASTALAWIKRLSPLGERGVDLFFVLSGFLITGILLRTRDRPHYFRNFMVRRAVRIFPLYPGIDRLLVRCPATWGAFVLSNPCRGTPVFVDIHFESSNGLVE